MSCRWAAAVRRLVPSSFKLKIFLTIVFSAISANAPGQAKAPTSYAQPVDRIAGFIDDQQRVTLPGNRHPLATGENDIGAVPAEYPMQRMVMTLLPDPLQQLNLNQFVQSQYDPESPNYHQWLTPEQYAGHFGVSEGDIAQITDWLKGHGFEVEEVTAGHRSIIFTGSAGQVQKAFHTQIHGYLVDGIIHHGNAQDPEIPAVLAGVVGGVVSLHDFRSTAMHSCARKASPEFSSGGQYYLSPADFATIYNLNPAYQAGINGGGQSLAIVARSNLHLSDVTQFRSSFGLPANNPQVIVNGTDPGIPNSEEETEADLDAEWSGAIARNAAVKFVVSKSTNSTDGIDLSAEYIVDHDLAAVMSMSFGLCEAWLGSSGNNFFDSLWQQAAAEGITVFVSSGDNGAAGCDLSSSSKATHGMAVNGLCSTPYNVCVGGTQFNDVANPSLYWSSFNSGGTQKSALGYIPEIVWNESGPSLGLWASGGGASTIYSKPNWQSGMGVPADGRRDVPDVALTAAGHDGYLIVQDGGLYVVGGTSAASPSFAGIMALLVQNSASRQGNANVVLYPLASRQRADGAEAFHDITVGNNSVPGEAGFNAAAGYDRVTGLGSVDAFSLMNHWNDDVITPTFQATAAASSLVVTAGSNNAIKISVVAGGGFSAPVSFSVSGLPSGVTAAFAPASLSAPGSGSVILRMTASSAARTGTYSAVVTASSSATRQAFPLSVTVQPGRETLRAPSQ
jgi:pseudomonalisin